MVGVGGAESSPAVSPALGGLFQALADYRPSADRRAEAIGLAHFRDLVELALSRAAGELAGSDDWDDDGYTTPISWLRSEAKLATGVAADRVAVGCGLALLPGTVDALERGEIGFAHLSLMVRTSEACRNGTFTEPALLERAKQQTVTEFRRTCEHYRHAQDPAGFAADEAEAHSFRFLKLSPQEDGALWLKGWLDPEGGSLLRSALEPLARPCGLGDDRDREQRLADALVEAVTRDHQTELVVTCSLETLEGRAGTPAAETEWGGILSRDAVERLACGANLRRLVLDGDSVVIDLGRRRRLLSSPARRALEARDRHCVWPGCDRPARWCQSHHKRQWSRGGATAVSESVLLCGRHHRLHHDRGWLVFQQDGRWVSLPPPLPTFPAPPPTPGQAGQTDLPGA